MDERFTALGNERFEADGATFVRNRETPDIWDANYVSQVTASTREEIERLLERVAGKQFMFADLGETELRGFEDPVRLYDLRWREAG